MKNSQRWIEICPGVRRRMLVTGEKMYQQAAELDAGSVMPAHSHPHEQILYVVSGKVRLLVDGVPHELSAGQAHYLAGNVSHGIEVLESARVIDTFSPPREDYVARDAENID